MKKQDKPIEIEESFYVPIEKVWNALTDVDEMKRWYFDNIDSFIPDIGAKSRFAVNSGERIFTHLWEIIDVVPYRKIAYTWKYLEYKGDSYVTFELYEKPDFVKLVLTVVVTEDFPDEISEFKRESCIGGWTYFINGRLKEYLEKSN